MSDKPLSEVLAELRRLDAAATPAPWVDYGTDGDGIPEIETDERGRSTPWVRPTPDDNALLLAVRNALPRLLAANPPAAAANEATRPDIGESAARHANELERQLAEARKRLADFERPPTGDRWTEGGVCVRHKEPGCPSCLKYDLNDARRVGKLLAKELADAGREYIRRGDQPTEDVWRCAGCREEADAPSAIVHASFCELAPALVEARKQGWLP